MRSVKKLLLLFFLCSVPAYSAPNFTHETGVLLSTAVAHQVLTTSTGFRMYLSTVSYNVQSATSTDGVTWGVESGVRISTGDIGINVSSITSFGAFYESTITGGPYRAYFTSVDMASGYALMSAKSTNGLTWTIDSSWTPITFSGAYINTPRVHRLNSSEFLLYYVRDSLGLGNPSDYRIYRQYSADKGQTFSSETALLSSVNAYAIDISTRTDGRVRMFISAPLSPSTTASQVLSALSNDNGYNFSTESGVRFSTTSATNAITSFAVQRSTETQRWRLYYSTVLNESTTSTVYSALTYSPLIYYTQPTKVYQNDPLTAIECYGEIFSTTTPTAVFSKGSDVIPLTSTTRDSDLKLTISAAFTGVPIGNYSLTVTNDDGNYVLYPNALSVDYKPGYVTLTDNLFRPLKGGRARFDIVVFIDGNMTITAYTINGERVKKIYDGPAYSGTNTVFWSGDTSNGNTVASGMYLVEIKAPKVDTIEKIVVIK